MLRAIVSSLSTNETLVLATAVAVSNWFAMKHAKRIYIAQGYRKRDRELYAIQTAQNEFHAKYRTVAGAAEVAASREGSV